MLDSPSIVSIGWWLAMAALATATAVAVYFAWRPAGARSEKERRRRLKVNATGRFADGTVNVKYESQRPSNSIIICEEWSGLRNNGLDGRGPGGRNGPR